MKPALNREVLALRAKAQAAILGGEKLIEDAEGNVVDFGEIPADDQGNPAWLNGNALGQFLALENESALDHFNDVLERLATGRDEDNRVRIAAYGASHTQGDLYTGYLRYYLQNRFGNGGPGFIQVARLNDWYRKFDFKVKSTGFRTEHAQKKQPPEHGRFGLMGVAVTAQFPYAFGRVSPANDRDHALTANRYELYYSAEPKGGDLNLSVDDQPPVRLSGRADVPEARYHAFDIPNGWHEVEVRPTGNGPVRVYGLSVERTAPGVVIDTLGINGTRAANMLTWDQPLWHEHLQRRAPDLFILAYGTNETTDTGEPIATYEQNLREVLRRFRVALPKASCVLLGPGDFPREGDDGWKTRARLIDIIDAQRKVAGDSNCAFWDTFAYMGGEGSMHEWTLARPRLGAPDHIHLTARGYVKIGMAFGDALMRRYDDFHLQPD
jgi:lysophospholipase L1-like esterase